MVRPGTHYGVRRAAARRVLGDGFRRAGRVGEHQEPCDSCLEAGVSAFICVARLGLLVMLGSPETPPVGIRPMGMCRLIGVAPVQWTPDRAEEVFEMAKTHPPYAPEFRRQMVELVQVGRSAGELAREFGCCAQTIRNWVRHSDRDEGRRDDGLTSSELEELRRLRRENRRLREEREILKKAAGWFARETGSVPGRSSSS